MHVDFVVRAREMVHCIASYIFKQAKDRHMTINNRRRQCWFSFLLHLLLLSPRIYFNKLILCYAMCIKIKYIGPNCTHHRIENGPTVGINRYRQKRKERKKLVENRLSTTLWEWNRCVYYVRIWIMEYNNMLSTPRAETSYWFAHKLHIAHVYCTGISFYYRLTSTVQWTRKMKCECECQWGREKKAKK